jgi:DNA-directed RNA polymerase specialized sigma24 family protein
VDPTSDPLSVADLALLGRLFEERRGRLLAMLRRRIDPSVAARVGPEEVLGEASLDAARRWRWFQGQAQVSAYAWLYRVARDRLIEAWRRETRGRRDVRREMPWGRGPVLDLPVPQDSPNRAVRENPLIQRNRRKGSVQSGRYW